MRIFAGEWGRQHPHPAGMEEGQAIESNMVSRRIEAAQRSRRAQLRHRKNLLEYDEVMYHQRKRVSVTGKKSSKGRTARFAYSP